MNRTLRFAALSVFVPVLSATVFVRPAAVRSAAQPAANPRGSRDREQRPGADARRCAPRGGHLSAVRRRQVPRPPLQNAVQQERPGRPGEVFRRATATPSWSWIPGALRVEGRVASVHRRRTRWLRHPAVDRPAAVVRRKGRDVRPVVSGLYAGGVGAVQKRVRQGDHAGSGAIVELRSHLVVERHLPSGARLELGNRPGSDRHRQATPVAVLGERHEPPAVEDVDGDRSVSTPSSWPIRSLTKPTTISGRR